MRSMLLPLCWMAVTMTATALLLPPPDPPVTTCAATSCRKGHVCRIVFQDGKIGPRCLSPRDIPPNGGTRACGSSGHPLLRAFKKGKKTVYTVFKCKNTCPAPTLVCVNGVCCAGVDTCSLPKVVGPCKARIPRYYYDSNKKKCLLFFYGGCAGNDNNFKTLQDCLKTCGPAILPLPTCALIDCREGFKCIVDKSGPRCVPIHSVKPANICQLPQDRGPCEALLRRFYYDSKKRKCRPFAYGGCKGNQNNFKSKRACRKTCPKSSGGVCPPVLPRPKGSKGSCGRRCKEDRQCRKGEKCCQTGCGYRACKRAILRPTCATIKCAKGTVCKETPKGPQCVKLLPVGVCPPVLPRPKGFKGSCGRRCKEDRHCRKGEKCCQTGCGYRACKRTILRPTCATILCVSGTVCIETPQGPKCVPTVKP